MSTEMWWFQTEFLRRENSITFKIVNFSLCCAKNKEYLKSSAFTIDGQESVCELIVYPNGKCEISEGFISVYLHSISTGKENAVFPGEGWCLIDEDADIVICQVSIVDATGEKVQCVELPAAHLNSGEDKFISRSNLFDYSELFLPNDELTLSCTLIKAKNTYCRSGLDDELNLLKKEEMLTDVVLKAGETEIYVHKSVLASRSPVFESVFNEEMLSEDTNTVNITDIEIEVLQELVRFVYTEKCSYFNAIFTLKLLMAAVKYDITSLKERCVEYLCNACWKIELDALVTPAVEREEIGLSKKHILLIYPELFLPIQNAPVWMLNSKSYFHTLPCVFKQSSRKEESKTYQKEIAENVEMKLDREQAIELEEEKVIELEGEVIKSDKEVKDSEKYKTRISHKNKIKQGERKNKLASKVIKLNGERENNLKKDETKDLNNEAPMLERITAIKVEGEKAINFEGEETVNLEAENAFELKRERMIPFIGKKAISFKGKRGIASKSEKFIPFRNRAPHNSNQKGTFSTKEAFTLHEGGMKSEEEKEIVLEKERKINLEKYIFNFKEPEQVPSVMTFRLPTKILSSTKLRKNDRMFRGWRKMPCAFFLEMILYCVMTLFPILLIYFFHNCNIGQKLYSQSTSQLQTNPALFAFCRDHFSLEKESVIFVLKTQDAKKYREIELGSVSIYLICSILNDSGSWSDDYLRNLLEVLDMVILIEQESKINERDRKLLQESYRKSKAEKELERKKGGLYDVITEKALHYVNRFVSKLSSLLLE